MRWKPWGNTWEQKAPNELIGGQGLELGQAPGTKNDVVVLLHRHESKGSAASR